ncbi:MAG: PKD domain-containing protein [Fluviicola sp.]|nr:PKD domain-containing protein [Fluviicola sp.]
MINDFVYQNNAVYTAVLYNEMINPTKAVAFLRFHKVNSITGSIEWSRDYGYFPIDSVLDPGYSIKDIDTTADGGFLLAGVCFKWDDFQGNKPYQYGYLLKTNCLGFLGPPQAAVGILSSTTDSVVFINQSVQAGSYTWQFGDGQSTTTTEEVDTMVHHYVQAGTYTITLIAHGCNNENDTITFQHTIADPTPIYHGDGTLLTVFPNPLVAGNPLSAYIGAIDSPHDLVLVDELGKVLFKQSVVSGNTNYLLPTNQLAAAQYRLQLMQSNKMIESEAVIVVE